MREDSSSFLRVADFQRLQDRRIAPDGRYMCRIDGVESAGLDDPTVCFRMTVAEGPAIGHTFPYLLWYGEDSWRQVRMTCLALGIGPAESINLGAEDLEGREMPMIARTVYSGTHLATCFSISPPGDGLPASAGCRSHCKKAEGSSERGMGESVGDAGQEEDPW